MHLGALVLIKLWVSTMLNHWPRTKDWLRGGCRHQLVWCHMERTSIIAFFPLDERLDLE
jgi:hypothetical protein